MHLPPTLCLAVKIFPVRTVPFRSLQIHLVSSGSFRFLQRFQGAHYQGGFSCSENLGWKKWERWKKRCAASAPERAVRGCNRCGKHHLRRAGPGLVPDGAGPLPLYHTACPGNLHDSKLFHQVLDDLFGVIMESSEPGCREAIRSGWSIFGYRYPPFSGHFWLFTTTCVRTKDIPHIPVATGIC